MKRLQWRLAQFLEIRWWQSYLKQKKPAEYLQWKRKYWRNFLNTCDLQPQPGQKILDAGCGPAGIFILLDHLQPDALDPLLDRYERQLPHFQKANYPNTRFFSEPIETFRPDHTYDFIFCLNAINHVQDLEKCLDNLAAWTKPQGLLYISIDAHNYQALKLGLRLIPGDVLHPHQYDLEEYKKMLFSRGFTLEKSILIKKNFIFNYWLIVARRCS